jgi:2-polyprenyl-6-methoxyphenol hydroxylase-like FAD-dependent oxidoreductase
MTEVDVLIVGAGPTGLTLACVLAEWKVGFRIVDAAATPPLGSRGKGLQPRSLELLNGLSVAARIIANGQFNIPVRTYDETGTAHDKGAGEPQPFNSDTPYQSSLLTPQWRIEEALRDRLEQLGGRVEYGTELTGFTQAETAVSAILACGDDAHTIEAKWLVGCDGGKSAVRHAADIPFQGETFETYRMLVADVHVSGLDRDHWHMWRSPEGFLALCPLPSTDVFQFQGSVGPNQDSDTSLDTLQRMVERRTEQRSIVLSNPSWMSLWRANVRMVDRYRTERVFVAGDAAHVHSPAGGQGMNTGIQDAFNLGWKLAAVIKGAEPILLDTYQQERLPIAAGVLKLSSALMSSTVATGSIAIKRDRETMQLGLNYRGSSLSKDLRPQGEGLRAGDRAPEASGLRGLNDECSIFDLLRGPHFTLLGFGAKWRPVIDACVERHGTGVTGYVIVKQADQASFFTDVSGAAHAAYAEDTLFVVRPDHYVGAATSKTDVEAISIYLGQFLLGSV